MPQPKPQPKGKGLSKKVMGMPVWVWLAAAAGGLLIGLYLRNRSGGSAVQQSDSAGSTGDGTGLDLSAGATPSDNGLGSSSADLTDFLQQESGMLTDFLGGMQDLIASNQANANWGDGGFTDTSGSDSPGGDSTGTVTLGLGNTGDLNLSALTPASIKAAWAQYNATQKRQGIHTQTTVKPSTRGTTSAGWTQVSGPAKAAAKKVKAIFVPAHKGERAHWALPGSGRWVSGPGVY